jgi:hypothetical protein
MFATSAESSRVWWRVKFSVAKIFAMQYEQLCLGAALHLKLNLDAGRVVLASARTMKSKLNHAVEATNVKLPASKTAPSLNQSIISPAKFPTDN